MWWAIVTVTTVGYGDSFPQKEAGRVVAIAAMVIGIGFIAALTAAAAERFIRAREAERRADLQDRLDEISRRLDEIERRG
jgi:voltage-gated potassium channel